MFVCGWRVDCFVASLNSSAFVYWFVCLFLCDCSSAYLGVYVCVNIRVIVVVVFVWSYC